MAIVWDATGWLSDPGNSYMELVLGYKKEMTEEGEMIFTNNNYEVIPPEAIYTLEDGTYAAFENGEYEFTVKILDTGEEIKEKVIVDELNSTGVDYKVKGMNYIYLVNSSTETPVTFKVAWMQYDGKRINVSDRIKSPDNVDSDYNYLDIESKLGTLGGETVTVIIMKDGKVHSIDIHVPLPN